MVRPPRSLFVTLCFLTIVAGVADIPTICHARSKAAKPGVPAIHVAADGSAEYSTVQAAIDHVPATGAIVLVAPGTYREQVIVNQSNVTIKGTGTDPSKTIIVDDTSQGTRGNKPSYATVHVLGDNFRAENITFQNDFNRTHEQVNAGLPGAGAEHGGRSQHHRQRSDTCESRHALPWRERLRSVREPSFAASQLHFVSSADCSPAAAAPRTPCTPTATRSYFTHCVVAGNVDFIYGDGNAVFNDCEIHNTSTRPGVTLQHRVNTSKTNSPRSSSIIAA